MIKTKMVLKNGFAIFFLLGLLLPLTAFGQERLSVQNPTNVNVRSGPGTEHDILWKAEQNYPVLVLETKNGWVRFKDFENYEGWMSRALLGKVDTVVVKRGEVNVRSGPGTNFDVVFKVEKAVPFKVISRKGDWIEVQHADGDKGWIKRDLVW